MAKVAMETRDYTKLSPSAIDRVLDELAWVIGSDNLRPVTPPDDDRKGDEIDPQDDRMDGYADDWMHYLLGWRVDAPKGKSKRTKKPNCKIGRSCGMSCVPMSRKCEPGLSEAAATVAKSVARDVGGGEGGGGQPPKAAPKAKPKAAAKPKAEPKAKAEPKTPAKPKAEPKAKPKSEAPKAAAKAKAEPKAPSKPKAEAPKAINTQALGKRIEDTFEKGKSSSSGVGSFFKPDPLDVLVDASPDRGLVAAFKRGESNGTLALVREVPDPADRFNTLYVPADSASARILSSAKEAGVRPNTVVVRDSDDALARALTTANRDVEMVKEGDAKKSRDIGQMMTVPAEDVRGGRITATQDEIDAAANAVRNGGGRAVLPVPVRQVGEDAYEVIGNANMLAVAQRAGVQPWIYIMDDVESN